jgi:hypothetical protein
LDDSVKPRARAIAADVRQALDIFKSMFAETISSRGAIF